VIWVTLMLTDSVTDGDAKTRQPSNRVTLSVWPSSFNDFCYYHDQMAKELRPTADKAETFDKLDIRVGRIVSIAPAADAPRPAYVIRADFGKFGVKTSVGRFTMHSSDDLIGKQVLGVLNFEPREIGGVVSEFLCLGVQYPKADSGEATIITPLVEAKLGSKLF
jgi:tRNA-binding protein